jgi:hypothetical protein
MNPSDLQHNAVNWEFGMLVAPDHFLRQERFYEAGLLWLMRYTFNGFGLVGGGARLSETEFGALRNDPVITLSEDEPSITISVTQCRGVTMAGNLIEILPGFPVHSTFARSELDGVREARIYLIAPPHNYRVVDGPADELNPQIQTERIRAYKLVLHPHGDAIQHAIVVGRIRRSPNASTFEKDSGFIPPCVSLVSFSELTGAWRRIVEQLTYLANRFVELHRAMQEYIALARERGIDTEIDRDSLEFVKRIIPAIESCLYDSLDPVQAPAAFFGHVRKFLHAAAVNLDLNPPVQQYFDVLRNAGETEFAPLIEQQKQLLGRSRRGRVEEDLALEVASSQEALKTLQILERALEGKYVDFRISPTLDAMNFVFDRGGSALYKLAAKPARLQGFGDEMTFHFAGLRMEGREKYRLIVSAPQGFVLPVGSTIPIEIRINEGTGHHRAPTNGAAEARLPEQRNFEFDFDAPDVGTITDLRVSVPAHFGIQTALLFVRHRFYAPDRGRERTEARPLEPAPRQRTYLEEQGHQDVRSSAPAPDPVEARPSVPAPVNQPGAPPPWQNVRRPEPADPAPTPRRRRLE